LYCLSNTGKQFYRRLPKLHSYGGGSTEDNVGRNALVLDRYAVVDYAGRVTLLMLGTDIVSLAKNGKKTVGSVQNLRQET
jgi:hypothetical protein